MGGAGLSNFGTIPFRGYGDGDLENVGGKLHAKFTAELRFPITLKPSATIYALAFLEGGNAGLDFHNYVPFKLQRSAGVGVRIFLPMFGLMGIDWGYGFDEVPNNPGENGSQFHFVIGQQF